jgi:hypothetical protein
MSGLPPAAVGSIVAALIAGTVSLLGLIIAKEQKTSEFRQQWAADFRADIADLIARISTIADVFQLQGQDQREWDFNHVRDHFVAVNQAMMKIRLRLDPTKSSSAPILKILRSYEEQFQKEPPDEGVLSTLEAELIAAAHQVLNEQWRRSRRGEPIFVAAKYVAAGTVAAALATALVALLSP